jgi:hypothetical protein
VDVESVIAHASAQTPRASDTDAADSAAGGAADPPLISDATNMVLVAEELARELRALVRERWPRKYSETLRVQRERAPPPEPAEPTVAADGSETIKVPKKTRRARKDAPPVVEAPSRVCAVARSYLDVAEKQSAERADRRRERSVITRKRTEAEARLRAQVDAERVSMPRKIAGSDGTGASAEYTLKESVKPKRAKPLRMKPMLTALSDSAEEAALHSMQRAARTQDVRATVGPAPAVVAVLRSRALRVDFLRRAIEALRPEERGLVKCFSFKRVGRRGRGKGKGKAS